MYLGYQGNKIKFYTEQPLNQTIYNLDRIEETDQEYTLIDEEYVLKESEEAIQYKKEQKTLEINNKIKELEQKSTYDILYNNSSNLKIYQDIIKGLEETRDSMI